MLAHILAVLVGTGSVGLYLSAFFFPEIHRKQDFIWSGVGFFYALTLWIYARQSMGGILVGQISSVVLLGWFAWQNLKLRRQLVPVSQQTPIPGTTRLQERLGNRLTSKVTNLPTPTLAKPATIPPPPNKNPTVQPSVSQKTAPVESNIPLPLAKNPTVQPLVSQKAAPVESNIPLPLAKNPTVQPLVSQKAAPIERELASDVNQISQLTKSPPDIDNDLAPTLRVDVVESTEKAWIKLEVKSSPDPKPLGTTVKPPTPLLPTAVSPNPQPPEIVAALPKIAPIDTIPATARLDEDWE